MRIPWFDLSEVQAFTAALVADLGRVRSGSVARGDKSEATSKRIEKLIEKAALFERERRLNFYKKAKLVALVREGLSAHGWPGDDIEKIIQRLLTAPLRRSVARDPG